MDRYGISEVKKAVASSRKWMRRHASTKVPDRLAPDIPAETVYFIIDYFLNEDSRRCAPQDFSDYVTKGMELIEADEADAIIDRIDDALDDVEDYLTDDELYAIVCNINDI